MLSFSLHLPRRDAFAQAAVDAGGDHVADGAAELEGGFDAAAREVGVFRVGGDEEGLYLWRELAVHLRELEFVFEVGKRAQAADYYAALLLAHEVDEQAVEVFDLDVRKVDERLARHYLAFLLAEGRALFGVDEHGDDEFVEERRRSLGYIDVAVRYRVERAGVHGSDHSSFLLV